MLFFFLSNAYKGVGEQHIDHFFGRVPPLDFTGQAAIIIGSICGIISMLLTISILNALRRLFWQ